MLSKIKHWWFVRRLKKEANLAAQEILRSPEGRAMLARRKFMQEPK